MGRLRMPAYAAVAVILVSLVAPSRALGQTPTGTLSGIVVDPVGAVVPDVVVLLIEGATALKRDTRTDGEGAFSFPLLPPGTYTLRATRAGFTPFEVPAVVLNVTEPIVLHIRLAVEGLSESVLVTAQKRGDERRQDVPMPVSVLNPQDLVSTNRLRAQDYFSSVPGLSIAPALTNSLQISIRGLNTGSIQANPSVGVVIDDIPYGSTSQWGGGVFVPDVDPNDLAQVEVLRGPQGTLYGAASLGGLLKFVTVDPSTDRLSAHLQVGSASIQNANTVGYNLRGSVNVPVSDTFAIRASAYTRDTPGYIDNMNSGREGTNEIKGKGGRLATLWRMSDGTTLKLSALAQRQELFGLSGVKLDLGDLKNLDTVGAGHFVNDIRAYSATLAATSGHVEFMSLTGYNTAGDSGIGPRTPTAIYLQNVHTDKFSQEFRLSMPLGRRLNWMIAAFYTKETTLYQEGIDNVDAITGELVSHNLDDLYSRGTHQEYAAFTNLTFKATDRVDVQFGARQAHFKQEFHQSWEGPFVPANFGIPSPYVPPAVFPRADAFTYLVTPRFKVSPDLMVYGRLASGYRAGGPNSNAHVTTVEALPIQQPDKTQNYELGMKAEFLDRKLSLDASLYYIDWNDIQVFSQFIYPSGQGVSVYTNAKTARSLGLELSLDTKPWLGGTVNGWGAWNTAELTADMPSNILIKGFSGDRLPYSPRFSGQLSLQQEFPLTGRVSGFAGGSVRYVGERISSFLARSSALSRQILPSYFRTDLNGGLRYDTWDINLYVNNVFDERGYISYDAINQVALPIQPRAIGLNLSKRF